MINPDDILQRITVISIACIHTHVNYFVQVIGIEPTILRALTT